jgi:hypothetical protein
VHSTVLSSPQFPYLANGSILSLRAYIRREKGFQAVKDRCRGSEEEFGKGWSQDNRKQEDRKEILRTPRLHNADVFTCALCIGENRKKECYMTIKDSQIEVLE